MQESSMPRKIKLILNPMANRGNAYQIANGLRPIVTEYGNADWTGTVYPTHATELAKQAALDGYDLVVALGGDGTAHEVANGLMQVPAEKRPLFGVVPVGTGNDFAYAMGMSPKADHALTQIFNGEARPVDVGILTDERGRKEYWVNTLGVGFDTVVTINSHKLPFLHGFMMYFTAVLQTILLNFDPADLHIETDQGSWDEKTIMLTACNGPREGGGFHIAPDALTDDGIFDFASVRKISRLMMLRLLPEVMKGTHGRFSCVRMGKFTRLNLSADRPLYIHTDGEIYTDLNSNIRKFNIEMLPLGLQVIRGK
jgi:diacylglycerol kinase (ATP)